MEMINVCPQITTSELADMCIEHGEDKEKPCPCGEFYCFLGDNGLASGKGCKDIETEDWEKLFNPYEGNEDKCGKVTE